MRRDGKREGGMEGRAGGRKRWREGGWKRRREGGWEGRYLGWSEGRCFKPIVAYVTYFTIIVNFLLPLLSHRTYIGAT